MIAEECIITLRDFKEWLRSRGGDDMIWRLFLAAYSDYIYHSTLVYPTGPTLYLEMSANMTRNGEDFVKNAFPWDHFRANTSLRDIWSRTSIAWRSHYRDYDPLREAFRRVVNQTKEYL